MKKTTNNISIINTQFFYEVWSTITRNKFRSFLTAFGVFWGMFMLVLMLGAGDGLQHSIDKLVSGYAQNSCFFIAQNTSLPYKGFQSNRQWSMLNSDIPILKQSVPEAKYFSPVIFSNRMQTEKNNVVRGDKKCTFGAKGCYPEYNKIDRCKIIKGRFINDMDIREQRKVCLIGKRVCEVLFDKEEEPLGQTIKIHGIYFSVIGICDNLSKALGGSGQASEAVILPFTTMQQAFNHDNSIDFLSVTTQNGITAKVLEEKISTILKKIHQIDPNDNDAVFTINIEEQFNMFNYLLIGVRVLIWIVGLGTLLAGAIGVSNIMLVTVRERTKEIGIRRALGATPFNITSQIIAESIVLTLLAGVWAVILGVGILSGVGIALSQGDSFFKDPQISFGAAIWGMTILIAVGTLSGLIPANRAMKIKAIDAIREE